MKEESPAPVGERCRELTAPGAANAAPCSGELPETVLSPFPVLPVIHSRALASQGADGPAVSSPGTSRIQGASTATLS